MLLNTELKCEKCGKVYARIHPNKEGHTIEVMEGGMNIRAVNKKERLGALVCKCGHETLMDLAALGVP
jgi:hypothetical protein